MLGCCGLRLRPALPGLVSLHMHPVLKFGAVRKMDYTVRSKVDESGSGGLGVGGAWGGGAPESGIVDQCVYASKASIPRGGRRERK